MSKDQLQYDSNTQQDTRLDCWQNIEQLFLDSCKELHVDKDSLYKNNFEKGDRGGESIDKGLFRGGTYLNRSFRNPVSR